MKSNGNRYSPAFKFQILSFRHKVETGGSVRVVLLSLGHELMSEAQVSRVDRKKGSGYIWEQLGP